MEKRRRTRVMCVAVGLAVLVGSAATLTAAPVEGKATACNDGRDNDRDGFTDAGSDPGCKSKRDRSEIFKKGPACDNGRDDDGDGTVDEGGGKKKKRKKRGTPDTGCDGPRDTDETAPPASSVTACSDGLDNEPDGLVDLADPGCSGPSDATETNPTGPHCDNGFDDDGDVVFDFHTDGTGDFGCISVTDESELSGGGGGGGGGNPPPVEPPPGGNPPPPPGNPPPATTSLTCTPSSIAFGDVEAQPTQQSRTRQVTCTASGGPVTVTNVSRTSGSTEFTRVAGGTCLGQTIAAGASCTETIRYQAQTLGTVSAVFTITHTGSNGARTVSVSGRGILVQG